MLLERMLFRCRTSYILMDSMNIKVFPILLIAVAMWPSVTFAKTGTQFETSGWIPYWRAERGVVDILSHLDSFTEVNPFVYTVRLDGSLFLNSPLDQEPWTTLRAKARDMKVRYVPSVIWANSDAMDDVLRDDAKRAEHIRGIVREVYARGFDGIDIDYEAKYARTRPYFSLFLKELYEAMGYDKWVMCTIEARTPLDSRYSTSESIPTDIEYANDFAEINKYCDRVRIMTYDQGHIDLKLNDVNADPYVPVADPAWVLKVIQLAALEIDPDKLVIGVPTYGYEYDMFEALDGSGEINYSRLWSFNPKYALDVAQKLGIEPTRNSAGEMFLIYPASKSIDSAIPLPFATRVMSWSDAEAIRQKSELASKLGVRGVAVFKIDDGQDPGLWSVLAMYNDNTSRPEGSVAGAGTSQTNSSTAIPSVAPSLSIPSRDLEFGMRNEDTRALQKLLNAYGFTVASGVDSTGSPRGGSLGQETTYFGPATRSALVRFQEAHDIIPARGYFGPITRRILQKLQSS